MKKRLTAMLLVVCMLFTFMPTAFAASENDLSVQASKTLTGPDADGNYTITLSVKGGQQSSTGTQSLPADVVLVVDTSTSMKETVNHRTCGGSIEKATFGYKCASCGERYYRSAPESCTKQIPVTRLDVAKAAAKQFVGGLLENDDIKIGLYDFSGSNRTNVSLTDNKETLNNEIERLRMPDWGDGTDYTLGLTGAENILSSSDNNRKNFVVFISDGEPTYGNNGVNKAQSLINSGVTIVTVGIDVDSSAANALKAISSTGEGGEALYYEASSNGDSSNALNAVLSQIQTLIEGTVYAGTDAVLTDIINLDDFDYVEDSLTAGEENVTLENGTLTWNIGNIGRDEKAISFQVKPKEGKTGTLHTNNDVSLTYTDTEGENVTIQKAAIGDPSITLSSNYTVTYTDGVEGTEVFADQTYTAVEGSSTPAFDGTPSRDGYTFAGWSPEVAETVTADVTYTAQWNANAGYFVLVPGLIVPDEAENASSYYPFGSETDGTGTVDKTTGYIGYITDAAVQAVSSAGEDAAGTHRLPITADNYEDYLVVPTTYGTLNVPEGCEIVWYQINNSTLSKEWPNPSAPENAVPGYHVDGYIKDMAINVIYHANYDEAASETKVITEKEDGSKLLSGSEYTILGYDATELPAREGYTFTGWNTKANNTGTAYAAGSSDTLMDSLVLYAQWEETKTPKVTELKKELVTSAPSGISAESIEEVTFLSEGETLPADTQQVTLLYKVTVTGDEGATYSVADSDATCVTGNQTGILPAIGSAVMYFTKTFTVHPGENTCTNIAWIGTTLSSTVVTTITVDDADPEPEVPAQPNSVDIPVIVKCEDNKHELKSYKLLHATDVTYGQVEAKDGKYTSTATLRYEVLPDYVAQYNKDVEADHYSIATASTVKVTLVWNEETKTWATENGTDAFIIIAKCEDEEPVDPEEIYVRFWLTEGAHWTDTDIWATSPQEYLLARNAADPLNAPVATEIVSAPNLAFVKWDGNNGWDPLTQNNASLNGGAEFTYNGMLKFAQEENGEYVVNLFAVFEDVEVIGPEEPVKTITVKYFLDQDGPGVAAADEQTFISTDGDAQMMSEIWGTAIPAGQHFDKWILANDRSEYEQRTLWSFESLDAIVNGNYDENGNAVVVFYAKFADDEEPVDPEKPEKQLIVKFDNNGGDWTDSVPANYDRIFTLWSTTPDAELIAPEVSAPEGKVFSHWESRTQKKPDQEFVFTYLDYGTLTDYDVTVEDGVNVVTWTAVYADKTNPPIDDPDPETETFTVKFEGGSHGSIDGKSKYTYEKGDKIDTVPDVERDSSKYRFDGWYCKELKEYYDDDDEIIGIRVKQDLTFVARWYKKSSSNSSSTKKDDDKDVSLNTEEHFQYIFGMPDGTVRPLNSITRAEVASIFYRLLDDRTRDRYFTTENDFPDVNDTMWYNKAVSTLVNAGIITGCTDGQFHGGRNITRAELATIIAKFDDGRYSGRDQFDDIAGHWARDYINTAAENGWVVGDGTGMFRPYDDITRAEVMTMVNAVLNRSVDEDGLCRGYKQWPDNIPGAWYYYQVIEATNYHEYEWTKSGEEDWTDILPDKIWDEAGR